MHIIKRIKDKICFWSSQASRQFSMGYSESAESTPMQHITRKPSCDSDVSVRPSVCLSVSHTPVLCLAKRKQDREMYTI